MKSEVTSYRASYTLVILSFTLSSCAAQVSIARPPESITMCRGSDVTISCGYSASAALPVTWIINGTSFTQQEVIDSPLYQLNNPTTPRTFSLTVFSINSTTTFQCVVQSTTSRRGTVTVTNKRPAIKITAARGGFGYVYVSWTVIGNVLDDEMCRIDRISVTLSAVNISITEIPSQFKISHIFTGLSDNILFNVTVKGLNFINGDIDVAFTSVRTMVIEITKPPRNITVCRGNDVTIHCGYSGSTALPVTWIINGTSFTQQEVVDSPLYQLNNPTSPMTLSLTVFYINGTTTFQCRVQDTTSTLGTVTVTTGPPALTVNVMKNIESSSIVVQWDEVDDSLTTTYTVTWTSERDLNDIQRKTVEEQSSYTVTGLTLDTVYTITVDSSNMCGGGPGYSTSVSLTTDITLSIIPTITTAINPIMSVVNSDTTTAVGSISAATTTASTAMINQSTYTAAAAIISSTATNTVTVVNSYVIPTSTAHANPVNKTTADKTCNDESDSSGLSTIAAVVITFAVTFIVSVTATAIITFIVSYVCVKRTFEKANNTHNPNDPIPQEKVLYEQVCIPSKTVTKNDLELQPNPAYGTSCKIVMDTNPAYESCK